MEPVAAGTELAPGIPVLDRLGDASAHQPDEGPVGGVLRNTEIHSDRPHRRRRRAAVVGPLEQCFESAPRHRAEAATHLGRCLSGSDHGNHAAGGRSSCASTHRISASSGTRFWLPNQTNGMPERPSVRSHSTVSS